jgi:hypothetical protein
VAQCETDSRKLGGLMQQYIAKMQAAQAYASKATSG